MIKVNLLRNKVSDSQSPAGGGFSAAAGDSGDLKGGIIKLVLIGVFTLVLMFVESQRLRALQAEVVKVQGEVTEIEAQAAAKAKETEGIKEFESQARELEDKLKVLKLLSKLRLREVKTLDFIQSSIPEKVWLKGLKFDTEADRVEHGAFEFKGNAVTTEELTEFAKRLEDSAYLNEVIVLKNQEATAGSNKNSIREFLFTAQVEVKQ